MSFRLSFAKGVGRLTHLLTGWIPPIRHWSGAVARWLAPNILSALTSKLETTLVAGHSGTSATVSFITHGLMSSGLRVLNNDLNSRNLDGLISHLLFQKEATHAVLQIDPAYLPQILSVIHPSVLVITNLIMDQSMDKGQVDRLKHQLVDLLEEINVHLVIPADDPLLAAIASEHIQEDGSMIQDFRPLYYSENKRRFRPVEPKRILSPYRTSHCPRCTRELTYTHYGALGTGRYSCHNCGFKNPPADLIYQSSKSRLTIQWTQSSVLPGQDGLRLESSYDLQGELTARYVAASLAALHRILPYEDVRHLQAALSTYAPEKGQQERFEIANRELLLQVVPQVQSLNEHLELALEDPLCLGIVIWLSSDVRSLDDLSPVWDIDMTVLTRASGLQLIIGGKSSEYFQLAMHQQFIDTPEPEVIPDPYLVIERIESLIQEIPENGRIYLYPDPSSLKLLQQHFKYRAREGA